jgi:hypothetical protein
VAHGPWYGNREPLSQGPGAVEEGDGAKVGGVIGRSRVAALDRLGAEFLAPGIKAAGKLAGIGQPGKPLRECRHHEGIRPLLVQTNECY